MEDAHTLDALEAADDVTQLMWPAASALGILAVPVDAPTAELIANGRPLNAEGPLADLAEEDHVALTHEGRLLAIYQRETGAVRPVTVIPGGVL